MNVSAFFEARRREIEATRSLGPVLDLACGRGRHALACASAGLDTLGLDRNASHLRELAQAYAALGRTAPGRLDCVRTDLETGAGIPITSESCGAVLVFRFLFRPLCADIVRVLAPGGCLVYETFTTRQRELGTGPSRDAFLLEPGELPTLFPGLEPLVFEEGPSDEERPSWTARLLARKPGGPGAPR